MTVEQAFWRETMVAEGKTHGEIAAAFIRRYELRPRTAFRLAHGWTLLAAVARINSYARRIGLAPDGRPVMRVIRLWEIEHLPYVNRAARLTAYNVALLAAVYRTNVHTLIDDADRDHMRPGEWFLIGLVGDTRAPTIGGGRRDRHPPTTRPSRTTR